MARYDVPPADAVEGTLQIHVADVAQLARDYARLGLRIIDQSRDRVRIALPCGVTLVLLRRGGAGSRRPSRAKLGPPLSGLAA
jgi:hypothetical protein